jgi:hypothetical protein
MVGNIPAMEKESVRKKVEMKTKKAVGGQQENIENSK